MPNYHDMTPPALLREVYRAIEAAQANKGWHQGIPSADGEAWWLRVELPERLAHAIEDAAEEGRLV